MSEPQHYFSADPATPDAPRSVRLVVDARAYTLRSSAGVFSATRVDPGTRVLLDHAPPAPPTGTLLDLGCGYGPLTCALAIRAPAATVWAVDVNARARELTAANAATLGLSGVRVSAPDDVPADVRFDAIWSNPSIRVGKLALHAMLTRWLDRLADGAAAHFVVARNLGADSLQRWLGEQGWVCDRVTSVRGYRVLAVRR